MHVYLLLDRSGSMETRWAEALGSINAYVADLAAGEAARVALVTLAVFDEHVGLRFDVVRRSEPVSGWRRVSEADAVPRGATPLFDAIGRLTALAAEDGPDRAVIVVMTDGYENASREITKAGAKVAFDRCRARGWQVVFLGADFDAMAQAAVVGTVAAQTLNVTAGHYRAAAADLAGATEAYAAQAAPIAFSPAARARAGAPVTRR